MLREPRRNALIMAVGYLAVTLTWVFFSAEWTQALAGDDVNLFKAMARYQDTLFITGKAIAIYFFCVVIFKRIGASARNLVRSEELRLEAERKALPALMAGSVAHDIANLLTVMRFNIERLKKLESESQVAMTAIEKLDRSTDRLTDLVQRLRGASKDLLRTSPLTFNFAATVNDTIEMMESHSSMGSAQVMYVGPSKLQLRGYPVLIHQLVMNLILNAAEAMNGRGLIRITAVERGEGGVCLVAEDEGPGVPTNLRQMIFGPFFTTKENGSGLGLMSVRMCVEMHEGTLTVEDAELGGAKFIVTLPNLCDERVEELRRPEGQAPLARVAALNEISV